MRCIFLIFTEMVLLLGASGLLGHNVLRLLLERGVRVRVLLRPGSGVQESRFYPLEVLRGSAAAQDEAEEGDTDAAGPLAIAVDVNEPPEDGAAANTDNPAP